MDFKYVGNKYTFNKIDNNKLQIFLDKLDISSNNINENDKKELIKYLLIFVSNFIDDQCKTLNCDKNNLNFEIITKCLLIINKLIDNKDLLYEDLLSYNKSYINQLKKYI